VSRITPFTEYLGQDEAVWCDPASPSSIAEAMAAALSEPRRSPLARRGRNVAARHDWLRTARAHLPIYEAMREAGDA
jgi:glycosyltransferase involved in cell wall biosynthesis